MKMQFARLRERLGLALRASGLLRGVALAAPVALAVMAGPAAAQSGGTMVVNADRGGYIGQRSAEIRFLRATGQRVEVRGLCLSACTMYLSLPNMCVAPDARLGFHGPSRNGRALAPVEFDHWSEVMAESYREPLLSWFMNEGRYRTSGYYEFTGAALIRMGYPAC